MFYADVLINVVDISDIDYKNKERITIKTLRMANVSEEKIKNMITVYNKVDLSPYDLCSNKKNYISAYTGYGIEEFKTDLINFFLIIRSELLFLRDTSLNSYN